MIKLAIGGQMDKQLIAKEIEKRTGDGFSYETLSDIKAALAVKNGSADYYVGACATGAGGALGMALGILGGPACASISIPGKRFSASDIDKLLKDGKKAFGFVNQDIDTMVPLLLERIKASRN